MYKNINFKRGIKMKEIDTKIGIGLKLMNGLNHLQIPLME